MGKALHTVLVSVHVGFLLITVQQAIMACTVIHVLCLQDLSTLLNELSPIAGIPPAGDLNNQGT